MASQLLGSQLLDRPLSSARGIWVKEELAEEEVEDFADMLIPSLSLREAELESGRVAVFRAGRLRVRRLPIAPVRPSSGRDPLARCPR